MAFCYPTEGDEAMTDDARLASDSGSQPKRAEAYVPQIGHTGTQSSALHQLARGLRLSTSQDLSHRLPSLVVALIAAFVASVLACLDGMAAALGWPLSEDNVEFALWSGCWSGVISSPILGAITFATPPAARLVVALGGAVFWALLSGFCFFVYAAGVAAC
jgi:hypothetical protein